MPETILRAATISDASVLATLVNHAGEGLPLHLWTRMAAPSASPWDVGRQRAAREEGGFSYRNATVAEQSGACAAALIGYEIPDDPEPIGPDLPPIFVPLQQLENLAPGTWYVNVLAVLPEFRGRGLGNSLLAHAEETGRRRGRSGMSVIVSDSNPGARRLYERCGYRVAATRPKVKEDWENPGRDWILLVKSL